MQIMGRSACTLIMDGYEVTADKKAHTFLSGCICNNTFYFFSEQLDAGAGARMSKLTSIPTIVIPAIHVKPYLVGPGLPPPHGYSVGLWSNTSFQGYVATRWLSEIDLISIRDTSTSTSSLTSQQRGSSYFDPRRRTRFKLI